MLTLDSILRKMTTYADETVQCAACGHLFTARVLASTNRFGSPDLDGRPPAMQRDTMGAWLQRCPNCGYCAPDITKFEERLRPVLNSPEYRAQLDDGLFPVLASTFLCRGMMQASIGSNGGAGRSWLCAAWVLDDLKKDELARACRSRAANAFLAALDAGEVFDETPGASEAIVADCLRRAGRSAEALRFIHRVQSGITNEMIAKVLRLQIKLIENGDEAAHLIKEAANA